MFCWHGNFPVHEDDDRAAAAPSSPKGCKKKHRNPYSTRGLDKFSEVMSELQAKREQIMATAGSQGASAMVLFMYTNSYDWTPIVVKPRGDPPKKPNSRKPQLQPPTPTERSENKCAAEPARERKVMEKRFSWRVEDRRRPSYYWAGVMVVLLVCLVMFGRVFAICSTTIWWYLVPTMKGGDENYVRMSMKKKDLGRRMSDKRLGGGIPAAVVDPRKTKGLQESTSPRSHSHWNGK